MTHLSQLKVSSILAELLEKYGFETELKQQALLSLLQINGVDLVTTFQNKQHAAKWLHQVSQKLLRKGERWSDENAEIDARLKKNIKQLEGIAEILNMRSKLDAETTPHIAIWCGALEERLRIRLDAILNANHIPQKVIAATGYRKLLNTEVPELKQRRTEADMINYIWQQQNLSVPFTLASATHHEYKTRSTTVDTAVAMAKLPDLKNQTFILYIEHPYAQRFKVIFEKYLQSEVLLQSSEWDVSKHPFLLQDEIARKIYFDAYAHPGGQDNWRPPSKCR